MIPNWLPLLFEFFCAIVLALLIAHQLRRSKNPRRPSFYLRDDINQPDRR